MTRISREPAISPPPSKQRGSSSLVRLLPYLLPYRWRWIVMSVIALASTGATIVIPLMTRAVIDGPIRNQDQQGLWVLGAAAMGIGITEAALWFIRRWLVARATLGVEADIRKDLYARLQILPMSFHGQWQSGQLLSRVMNDLSAIRQFLSFGLLFLVLNGIQIVVVTAILLSMYWPLGVVVVVSVVPITLTVLHFQRKFTKLSRLSQDQAGHVATDVEEAALGMRVVKSFGREDYSYERFDEKARALYDTEV
ncbi:MAG: transporter related protein, partial [Mycobacterium sp.]|nr:transporter related protein [Mycobacterium sp.]